ncbi:family 78 glycoside hydrolase catalytic domain [Microbacterium sp. NPDC089318]
MWQEDRDGALPVLARAFTVEERPQTAQLRVAGLGVFTARINGQRVSEDLLEPGYSDYAHRVEFCVYEVADLLRAGENVISIELGPGLYRSQGPDGRWTKIFTDYGDLAACVSLEWLTSKRKHLIATDTTWTSALGPVRRSNWIGGEDYDARFEVALKAADVRTWQPVAIASMPEQLQLTPKTTPPLRIIEQLPPVAITEPASGTFVIDFGVNFAGWVEIDLPAETFVRLRPAELLHPDGSINEVTQGWGPVFHTVRTASAPLSWHPSFMYNGLRYLEITGLDVPLTLDAVRAHVIAANAEPAGEFECSDAQLTDLHRIIRRAITSNMFSVFTDCPQREKLGYLEQLHLVFRILRWNFDVQALLTNTLRLVRAAQEPSGHIPLYVPEWDPFPPPWRGDVNFGLAIVFLPWQLALTYDDDTVLAENIDAATAYVNHLLESRVDGLIADGLGDWNGRDFRYVPLVATATLARALQVMARIAERLGDVAAAERWCALHLETIGRLRERFVGVDEIVGEGSVAELVVALDSGVVEEGKVTAAVEQLEAQIARDGYALDVGEVAMAALVRVLGDHDRHETLYRLIVQDTLPGYGYMLRHGATSLTETWDGPTFGYSQNHFMNGAIDDWFFTHLAGVQDQEDSAGFRRFRIRPKHCGGLRWVRARHKTRFGFIRSSWEIRNESEFSLEVEIPPGTEAEVELPDGTLHTVAEGVHRFRCAYEEVGA